MKISIGFKDALTFTTALVAGFGAAVAMASAAAVSQAAPTLRSGVQSAPVIRLEPVVVTVSKARFDMIRNEEAALARAGDARKVTRG